jgi:hypothetical protein
MDSFPSETLTSLVRALDTKQIPYAIIGGVAVSLMATPRHTLDVDAVLWVPNLSIEAILIDLESAGLFPRSSDPITGRPGVLSATSKFV